MSDKDCVSRSAVLALLNTTTQKEITNECYDRLYDAVARMDAVPQEMSAREFARVRNRMCLFHFPFCNGCAVLPERKECGEVVHDCPLWTLRDPDKSVAIVEAWAREHPAERSEE